MPRGIAGGVVAGVACAAILLSGQAAALLPKESEKDAPSGWEYKAVSFGADEKDGTKQLNDLARDGWEYVGPLGNGMVAFKRRIRSASDVELEKLQGTWVLVSREEGGEVVRFDDDSITFTITGNKWVWKDKGDRKSVV